MKDLVILVRIPIVDSFSIPTILVMGSCFASLPDFEFGSLMNPDFRHGKFQSIVTLLLLLISFIGEL